MRASFATNIRTTEINSEGHLQQFTKICTHENNPLYGNIIPYPNSGHTMGVPHVMQLQTVWLTHLPILEAMNLSQASIYRASVKFTKLSCGDAHCITNFWDKKIRKSNFFFRGNRAACMIVLNQN